MKLFGPGTDSGTFDFFTEEINGRARQSRSDYQPSENDNVLVSGVAGERGGLGYFGYSYYLANKSRLKLLKVDGGSGCVAPSVKTVQNRTYKPLSRPLYVYVKRDSLRRPVVAAFVRYVIAKEAAIAKQAGFIALTFVTPRLRDLGLDAEVFNFLSAGLVMGVMLIPTVASISEDAMSAVPGELRSGAYALGSTRLQVSTRIVVPAAISGIIASFVLAVSRAIGETMIVVIAAGLEPKIAFQPLEAVETMTAFIASTGQGDVPTGSIEYKTIFAVGATLFVMTFVVNLFAIRLVRRFREVYE